MHAESVEYHHAGRRYLGHLALPDGDDIRAAVLVCHEGTGLDEHAKQRAERLADLGYVALALDYFGDGQPIDMSEVRSRLAPLLASPEITRDLARAGLDVLRAHRRTDPTRVAAIGYCFGGTMALELARGGADLRAVVGFHSGLSTVRPEDAANIRGVVLVCIGADDPLVPAEQRLAFEDEMRAADVDWRMNVYGRAVHSFTNERADERGFPGISYHGPSDSRSWRAMLDVFDEVLSGSQTHDVPSTSAGAWPRFDRFPPTPVDPRFVFEALGPEHNERDHAAWMSSIDHIRATPGFEPDDSVANQWPVPMSLEQNLGDLQLHAAEFAANDAYALSVIDRSTADVVGCVYIDPDDAALDPSADRGPGPAGDVALPRAKVTSWVRADHAHLDQAVASAIAGWLNNAALFAAIRWPGRPDLTS